MGFLEWMGLAVQLVVALLVAAWWVLARGFKVETGRALVLDLQAPAMTTRGRVVAAVFAVTVALWITEGLHGLPAGVVALLPLVLLVMGGLIERTDVNRLDWDMLLLIAGGLALGFGLSVTGLDQQMVGLLPAVSGVALMLVLMALTLALSTFLSNTAVANLILPIGLAAAVATGGKARGRWCWALH